MNESAQKNSFDAHSAAPVDDLVIHCAFCGESLDHRPGIAPMMHEAHEALERLALAEPGSEEFAEALDEMRRFVGVAP